MFKHDFFGVKQAKKNATVDGVVIFGLKMDWWAFFSQLRILEKH